MAITHRVIATSFIRGQGILDLSARYQMPIVLVEHSLRVSLKRDIYVAPEQLILDDNPDQMTIAEVYGEITV